MIKRRVVGVCCGVMMLLLGLTVRLYYIQVLCGEELAEGARGQQSIAITGKSMRGVIYDRNLVPLTDCSDYCYYLLPREKWDAGLETLMQQIDGSPAGTRGEDYVVYRAEQYDREINRKLREDYGAYVFCSSDRYADDQLAAHLIGYVDGGAQEGLSGLEKLYQQRLASASWTTQALQGDGAGSPIMGLGLELWQERESLEASALVTTLDAGLQQEVETIMDDAGLSGAVVVLQTETGQVLAMASTPGFNPNDLESYLNGEAGELMNKALQGQSPPGSVFKIVTAAAALESGLVSPEDTFVCSGTTTVNGVTLTCNGGKKDHGAVDMTAAFAQSCNCYFAQAGKIIGAETIIAMAEKLGFGQTALEGFDEEERGSFPDESERTYSGLSNLSIGQGSLLVTPVQVARMTNIIASGGVDRGLSVIIGREAAENQEIPGTRVLSQQVAMEIGRMMEEVCLTGTAAGAQVNTFIAGKTGSAESSTPDGETVHGWFTGYFPAEQPTYTVTVFVENGKTGSGSALPVFEKIVNWLNP